MTSQLLPNKTDIQPCPYLDHTEDLLIKQDLVSYHKCLVANYMSYLNTAGYSKLPQEIRRFERGAWRFLTKYPDPQNWLNFSVDEQYHYDCKERSFIVTKGGFIRWRSD